jgi:hypothetical protein
MKYFGTEITSNGALQSEVQHQVHKSARISGCLNDAIWPNKYLRLEAKVRIYKSVVRPILTYYVETRADISKTKQLLETTEMNTLKKLVGKIRSDHVTNQDISNAESRQ